ncbi:MAG: hypothetical protein ACRECY_02775 [Phyllobacterium sp.]
MVGHAAICGAIAKKQTIHFVYRCRRRTVEPHLVGYDSDGDLTSSAWQLSGGSSGGWRDFHIAKPSELSISGKTFEHARKDYNPGDETVDIVLCRL